MAEEQPPPTPARPDPDQVATAPADETTPADSAVVGVEASAETNADQATANDSAEMDLAAAAADAGAILDEAAIDQLLKEASFDAPGEELAPAAEAEPAIPPAGTPLNLPDFNQVIAEAQVGSIDLLRDVELNVKIELGRSKMLVEDVLKLSEGSVVELDKLAGDPVDVFVNERLVARGEVLVLNDNFCVRINEIVAAQKEEAD